MFPAAFIQNAAYEASSRVQSERSERLRELTPAARRCLTKREENGIIEYIKKQGGLKL